MRLWATSSSYAWGQRWTKVESEPWEIKAARENLTSRIKESLIKSKKSPRKEVEILLYSSHLMLSSKESSLFPLPKTFKDSMSDLKSIWYRGFQSNTKIKVLFRRSMIFRFEFLNPIWQKKSRIKTEKLVAHEK